MIFYSLSALINFFTSFVLGLLIFLKKKTYLNLSFIYLSLSVAFWSLAYFFWQIANTENSAIFWVKVLTIGSALIPIFYFRFTLIFLKIHKRKKYKFFLKVAYFLTIFFILISPSSLLVSGVEAKLNFPYWPNPGIFYSAFLSVFAFYALYAMYLYYHFLKKSHGERREIILLLLIGTGLAFFGGATNFPLWYNIPLLPIGTILVSVYVLFAAYAIVKHRAFDIHFIIKKSSVHFLSISIILFVSFWLKLLFNAFLNSSFIFVADLLLMIFAIYSFPIIKKYFNLLANKYFFSTYYDSEVLIDNLSQELRKVLNTREICLLLSKIFVDNFKIKKILIIRRDKKSNSCQEKYYKNLNVAKIKKILSLDSFFSSISRIKENVLYFKFYEKAKKTEFVKNIIALQKLKVEVLIVLRGKKNNLGYIALGKKESGEDYSKEDLRILEIIGNQVSIAAENALMYEEIDNFNARLRKEIANAVKKLRVANNKLKKLDRAKSEFISIASHQLRTPLTVIKGYISMILDGSFGRVSKKIKEPLNKVYASNERLIRLVESLLDVSRIEANRWQLNFKDVYVENIVISVIDELESKAKEKNIKLKYIPPTNDLTLLKIDPEKIRYVIFNLIDNAIKYTPEGEIKIFFEKKYAKLKFCVCDNGIGLSKEDTVNLFKKFNRSERSFVLNTEGTGIGLYVAKEAIKAHHGKIWAESKGRDKGSSFCFELPIKKLLPDSEK